MSDSSGIEVGTTAPEFTAPLVTPDGEVEDVSLSSLLDDRPVLLAFYTNDFSPDCIDEWCSFRDYDWFSSGEQVQVVGISKSRTGTHQRFINHLGLNFPLYSDRDLEISGSYGVRYRFLNLLPRARRSCFLVDQEGVVRYKWVSEHPLEPSRDTPPVSEIHAAVNEELGEPETETFGFS